MNAVVCSLYAVYIQATAHLCHWSGRVMATPIHPPRVASNSSRRLSGRELFLIIFLIPCVSGTRPSANKEPTSARTGDGAAKGTLGRRVKGCQPCADRLLLVQRSSLDPFCHAMLIYVAGDFSTTMPLPSHGRPMRRALKFASNPPGDLGSMCWPFLPTLSSG